MPFARSKLARHALRKLLLEIPAVAAMTNGRVASGVAGKSWTETPQNYIVFRAGVNRGVRTMSNGHASLWGTEFTVNCWGATRDSADDLADAAAEGLEAAPINLDVGLAGDSLRIQAVSVQEDAAEADGPAIHGQNKPENCTTFTVILWHEG